MVCLGNGLAKFYLVGLPFAALNKLIWPLGRGGRAVSIIVLCCHWLDLVGLGLIRFDT